MADRILYCLNLNLSMPFRVWSRSPVTCLYVTAVNNNFEPLPIFCHKEFHLRCSIELDQCCIGPPMIEYNLGKIFEAYPPWCPKSTFPDVFYIKLNKLASTHWHRLWLCYIFLCSIFSKGIQPFDFINCNIIRKLAYKVKYISHINRGLIMFFTNLRKRFC